MEIKNGAALFNLKDERVRDSLFMKIRNAEGFKDEESLPHKQVCDLVLTYHILIGELFGRTASVQVTNAMMEMAGIDLEQLHSEAVENAKKNKLVIGLANVMTQMIGGDFEDEEIYDGGQIVVSNKDKVFGASSIVVPEVLDELADKFHGDFFIMPSSVHECITMKDDGITKADELAMIVASINRTEVPAEDFLSDHVYRYSNETKEITIAA